MKTKAKQCNCTNCPCRMQKSYLPDESVGAIVKQKPEITFNKNRIRKDGKKAPDGIEIRFGETKPVLEVRELLKASGFRFSEHQKIWYARDNAKTRELAATFANSEVDVDNAKYEKINFWARVKTWDEYEKLRPYTEFMIAGISSQFFNSKSALEKRGAVLPLINSRILSFKKHYNKLVDEESEPIPTQDEGAINIVLVNKLKELADAMQPQIDAKIHSPTSKQRPTAKRLRVAAGMRAEGYKMRDVQKVLYALSDAHRTGDITQFPYLQNIRNKSQIELIEDYGRARKDNRSDQSIQDSFDRNKESFAKLGISSVWDLSLAHVQKNELVQKFSSIHYGRQHEDDERLRELETDVFSAQIPGFFPTPVNLIERLIELAEIDQSNHILEPSAGKGDIVDVIRNNFGNTVNIEVAEINNKLREILRLKGYRLVAQDFLEYVPSKKYDKIIMNPPFENGQDIDHVQYALKLLAPSGRLVAVMSEGVFFRQFKKDIAFREMLVENNAYVSEPIKEGFKNAFKSTGVAVRIVVINKDGSSPVNAQYSIQDTEDNKDMELIELEAQAELELLKMRVENEKNKRRSLAGISGVDSKRLFRLRQKALALKHKF